MYGINLDNENKLPLIGSRRMTTNSNKTWYQSLIFEAAKAISGYYIKTYGIPFTLTMCMPILGYIQNYRWMEIFGWTSIFFAAISVGLYYFDKWIYRQKVEGKLNFVRCNFVPNIDLSGDWIIGFEITSIAEFPITVEVKQVRTKIGTTVPAEDHKTRQIEVPAMGLGWFNSNSIKFNPPKGEPIKGEIEFEVNYGRSGSPLNCTLKGRKSVTALFDQNGNCTASVWNDAP